MPKVSSFAVIRELARRSQSIAQFRFVTVDQTEHDEGYAFLQADDFDEGHFRWIYKKAMKRKERYALPFWDTALSLALAMNHDIKPIKKAILRHNTIRLVSDVTRQEVEELSLQSLQVKAGRNMVAISSRVATNFGDVEHHLPLLDFHCKPTLENDRNATEIIKSLGLSGYLLNSGGSYHFISEHPMMLREWHSVLGKALLYSPFIDRNWIGHQLIQQECVLRISAKEKYGREPELINKIGQ